MPRTSERQKLLRDIDELIFYNAVFQNIHMNTSMQDAFNYIKTPIRLVYMFCCGWKDDDKKAVLNRMRTSRYAANIISSPI